MEDSINSTLPVAKSRNNKAVARRRLRVVPPCDSILEITESVPRTTRNVANIIISRNFGISKGSRIWLCHHPCGINGSFKKDAIIRELLSIECLLQGKHCLKITEDATLWLELRSNANRIVLTSNKLTLHQNPTPERIHGRMIGMLCAILDSVWKLRPPRNLFSFKKNRK